MIVFKKHVISWFPTVYKHFFYLVRYEDFKVEVCFYVDGNVRWVHRISVSQSSFNLRLILPGCTVPAVDV